MNGWCAAAVNSFFVTVDVVHKEGCINAPVDISCWRAFT